MNNSEYFQKIKKHKKKPWQYELSKKEVKKRTKKDRRNYRQANEFVTKNEYTH
jgi:hypothetical protein